MNVPFAYLHDPIGTLLVFTPFISVLFSAEIQERFIGFLDVSGDTTGENLSSVIETRICDLGLSMAHLRGQCYDGAGL